MEGVCHFLTSKFALFFISIHRLALAVVFGRDYFHAFMLILVFDPDPFSGPLCHNVSTVTSISVVYKSRTQGAQRFGFLLSNFTNRKI